LTHSEIAARVGCSREMISRLMKDLERGGYVQVAADGSRTIQSLPAHW
jgi:CRP/FNR family cyclic AMP-dependent transcriptional regulator